MLKTLTKLYSTISSKHNVPKQASKQATNRSLRTYADSYLCRYRYVYVSKSIFLFCIKVIFRNPVILPKLFLILIVMLLTLVLSTFLWLQQQQNPIFLTKKKRTKL